MRFLTALVVLALWTTAVSEAAPMFSRPPGPDAVPVTADAPQAAVVVVPVPTAKPKAAPKPAPRPQRAARPTRKLRVTAMAYALRGRTATGTYTAHGTIAVDPRVIPLGTRIYVPGYGWGRALDTGGAILGNKIDLWMPSTSQCYKWGVRSVTILVEAPPPQTLASRKGKKKPKR